MAERERDVAFGFPGGLIRQKPLCYAGFCVGPVAWAAVEPVGKEEEKSEKRECGGKDLGKLGPEALDI